MIEKAPLQAYSSALIFSPSCSLTRTIFRSKEPDWIVQKPKVDQHWNSRLATLMGHLQGVCSVAFSHDGQHIVSGSLDGAIKIWDAESGTETLTLQGHTDLVWSVAFDEKGKFITSKSNDETVKTWDVETGAPMTKCQGSVQWIDTFVFSPDRDPDTTRFSDESIRIVDGGSNTEVLALQGHTGPVRLFAFSPDCRHIASGLYDETVKIWDAVTGDEILTLQGHTRGVLSVCFSCDGRRVACGGENGIIEIWDVGSSAGIPTLRGHCSHRDHVTSFASTPDVRRIASTLRDGTVRLPPHESTWSLDSIPLQSEPIMPRLNNYCYALSTDGSWITRHGKNILWLPPEFRGTQIYPSRSSDVLPHMISIDCPSGRVWWIAFSSKHQCVSL